VRHQQLWYCIMHTLTLPRTSWLAHFLAVAVLLLAAPARAEAPPPTDAGPVFAEGQTLKSYFGGNNSRDRVVQVSVVVMALALFILLKKFVPDAGGRKKPADGAKDRRPEDDRTRQL
jgi:hypothetical protein